MKYLLLFLLSTQVFAADLTAINEPDVTMIKWAVHKVSEKVSADSCSGVEFETDRKLTVEEKKKIEAGFKVEAEALCVVLESAHFCKTPCVPLVFIVKKKK